jgi:uncharacterized protein
VAFAWQETVSAPQGGPQTSNGRFGADGDVVSFADGYPMLLTTTDSLDQLGDWLAAEGEQPVPMNRFRSNAVVTGFAPWAEDRWRRVRIGSVSFRVVPPAIAIHA